MTRWVPWWVLLGRPKKWRENQVNAWWIMFDPGSISSILSQRLSCKGLLEEELPCYHLSTWRWSFSCSTTSSRGSRNMPILSRNICKHTHINTFMLFYVPASKKVRKHGNNPHFFLCFKFLGGTAGWEEPYSSRKGMLRSRNLLKRTWCWEAWGFVKQRQGATLHTTWGFEGNPWQQQQK